MGNLLYYILLYYLFYLDEIKSVIETFDQN